MRRTLTLLVLIVVATATGCRDIRMPRLFSWNPIRQQRQSAAYWDPYPHDESHDVSMSDLRPRDFDRPMSEVKRAQMSPYAPLSLGK